jgi:hypothetical protein
LNSPFFRIISVVADFVTIATLITAIPFALLKRKQNLLAFRISNFLHYLLRIAFIIIAGLIILKICDLIYFVILLPQQGSINDTNYYWSDGNELSHLVAYFVSGVFGFSVAWIIFSFLWTSSWNSAKDFFNLFLPKGKFLIKQEPILEILSAIYKTNTKEVDVTQVVRKMVSNNKLTIKASNELAGDPDPGILKTLVINYRLGGKPNEVIVNEGASISIPL